MALLFGVHVSTLSMCFDLLGKQKGAKLEAVVPPNPASTLTRLSLRSRLCEGAAKTLCQQGHGSQSPGRLRSSLGILALQQENTDMIADIDNLPSGVSYSQHQDGDVIAWSYQNVPVNKGFFTFSFIAVLLFFGVALYFIFHFVMGSLSQATSLEKVGLLFFLVTFVAIDIGIVLSFQGKKQLEMIKITDDEIIVRRSGLIKPKMKRFKRQGLNHGVIALAFLWYGSGFSRYSRPIIEDGGETLPTLNLIYADSIRGAAGRNREILTTHWMRTQEQYQLFLLMKNILQNKGWDIDFETEYQPKFTDDEPGENYANWCEKQEIPNPPK